MNTVPLETIMEVWQNHCDLGSEETENLVRRFMGEQPALGIYLFANCEQLGQEAEESKFIPLTVVAWEAMTRTSGRRLKSVRPKSIDRAEEANIRMLENLEPASEFEVHKSVEHMVHDYNQRELVGFCLEILMAGHEETPELAPDRLGLELLWLKTVIDCLDKS